MNYRILFLDFDGVLNNTIPEEIEIVEKWDDRVWGGDWVRERLVKRLNQIVEATDALVVISSSWRRYWTKDQLQRILDERGFEGQVIGTTAVIAEGRDVLPKYYNYRGPVWPDRSDEVVHWIQAFVEKNGTGLNYAVLDDRSDLFQNNRLNLVNTNPDIGISDQDVKKAINYLNNF